MVAVIGPNFPTELAVAGLMGLPFSWNQDGVYLDDPRLTQQQKDQINAVVAVHDPTKPDPVSALQTALNLGVNVTSTSTPMLSGNYSLDPVTYQQFFDATTYSKQFGSFPDGTPQFKYPDSAGVIHGSSKPGPPGSPPIVIQVGFTAAQLEAYVTAIAPIINGYYQQEHIHQQGGTPTWPTTAPAITIP